MFPYSSFGSHQITNMSIPITDVQSLPPGYFRLMSDTDHGKRVYHVTNLPSYDDMDEMGIDDIPAYYDIMKDIICKRYAEEQKEKQIHLINQLMYTEFIEKVEQQLTLLTKHMVALQDKVNLLANPDIGHSDDEKQEWCT